MTGAVLSIGSNLGDPPARLREAVDAVRPWVRGVSPVFRTAPWGPVAQDDFLNAVVAVEDPRAAPGDWLARAQAAEQAAGRTRPVRWGPRTLDVDVITVTDAGVTVRSDDPQLLLPHPRAAQRAFVLVPWLALDPDAELAGQPVSVLVARLDRAEVDGVLRTDLTVV